MIKKILAVMLAFSLASGSIAPAAVLNNNIATEVQAAKKKTPSVKKIRKAIVNEFGDNYKPDVSLSDEETSQRFEITTSLYTDIIAEVPMISINIDTLVIAKAKNKNARKKLKKQLLSYKKDQIENSMQYPMNLLKLHASTVYVKDNYVFFIMLGLIDSSIEQTGTDEQIIEAYKAENKRAVDAINSVFK